MSPEVNSKMPTENYMYSSLEGMDLPEDDGYRYHSIIPEQPADISAIEIAENMEIWLTQWNAAMVDA
jgi:ABC-type thiamine transport system substrate-binding protein